MELLDKHEVRSTLQSEKWCIMRFYESADTFWPLAQSNLGSSDVIINHELAGNFSKVYNDDEKLVFHFVNNQGNPYNVATITNLFNFVSDIITR